MIQEEYLTKVREMGSDAIGRVRAFNRAVTTRIGALQDHYLGSARSLGSSRVLWEVDDAGVDVRDIRERLDLDSGYLSRLLRSLERLATPRGSVRPSPAVPPRAR